MDLLIRRSGKEDVTEQWTNLECRSDSDIQLILRDTVLRIHIRIAKWFWMIPEIYLYQQRHNTVKLANSLKLQAMWFCCSPFGIAHHSAKSSRVLISGYGFFIIHLIGTLVRGISSLQHCFVACACTSGYKNTFFWASVHKLFKMAPLPFNC